MSEPETIQARVERCLKDARANKARVFEAVLVDGGGFISTAHVYKILRGADDQGEIADRIRNACAEITGQSVEYLFGPVLNKKPTT